jgi:hypothetical protein
MPCARPASDRDTWIRTVSFLLLGSICYALPWSVFAALPIPSDNSSVLRIQGSNTIGARLGPALVKGLLEEQGLSAIRIEAGHAENEQTIIGKTPMAAASALKWRPTVRAPALPHWPMAARNWPHPPGQSRTAKPAAC